MKLVPNWRDVARRSYSMWCVYLGVLCWLMPEVLYFVFWRDTNPTLWGWIGIALLAVGGVGRLWDQGIERDRANSPGWLVAAILALVLVVVATGERRSEAVIAPDAPDVATMPAPEADFLALAVPFVGGWEGLRTTAYLDTIASPPVWTVCYGETRGVQAGDVYTKAECDAQLAKGLIDYRKGAHAALTPETLTTRLPLKRDVAVASLAYNIGISAWKRSTARKRLNGGDIAGACDAMMWWNKAGGRVVRGLVSRRRAEHPLCMDGVA